MAEGIGEKISLLQAPMKDLRGKSGRHLSLPLEKEDAI
jgi:hypothetical protein